MQTPSVAGIPESSGLSRGYGHWFEDTVSALIYSLARAQARPDLAEFQGPYNDLVAFVLGQHARMPDYLRVPFVAATLGFDLMGLPGGHLFHRQPAEARGRQIASWKNSTRSFQRDLMRYFESLATVALFNRATPSIRQTAASRAEVSSREDADPAFRDPERELRCQIAVVGSGPGGSITACLLAEAGRDVVLIEEGPHYGLESCTPFSLEEMLQKYRNGGQTVALGRNKIAYVEGRCVGGGSEINSGLYHRTPPEILEVWCRDFRVDGLTETELRPHFEANERELSVSLLNGPAPPASLKLHQGAQTLGWSSLAVPRWFRHDPANSTTARQSMTQTFIPRFLRAGGKLLSGTRILQIRQESGRWLLRAARASGRALEIQTEQLFLCCGAVQTPALLRRSGITSNIGNSLHVHPTIKIVAKFAEAVNAAAMGVPVHQVKEFAPRLSFGCSISTPPYLALGLLEQPEQASTVATDWPQMATYYAMITGEGHGTVRPVPGFNDPLVRYRLSRKDRQDLAEGLRKLAEILFAADAAALYPGITRGPRLGSRDDLTKLPDILPDGLANLMTIHLFSSCPMGEDKTKCAADSYGRVHGFRNLWIGDASLLCTAPGVNPQGSIMGLVRRNALRFLSNG